MLEKVLEIQAEDRKVKRFVEFMQPRLRKVLNETSVDFGKLLTRDIFVQILDIWDGRINEDNDGEYIEHLLSK